MARNSGSRASLATSSDCSGASVCSVSSSRRSAGRGEFRVEHELVAALADQVVRRNPGFRERPHQKRLEQRLGLHEGDGADAFGELPPDGFVAAHLHGIVEIVERRQPLAAGQQQRPEMGRGFDVGCGILWPVRIAGQHVAAEFDRALKRQLRLFGIADQQHQPPDLQRKARVVGHGRGGLAEHLLGLVEAAQAGEKVAEIEGGFVLSGIEVERMAQGGFGVVEAAAIAQQQAEHGEEGRRLCIVPDAFAQQHGGVGHAALTLGHRRQNAPGVFLLRGLVGDFARQGLRVVQPAGLKGLHGRAQGRLTAAGIPMGLFLIAVHIVSGCVAGPWDREGPAAALQSVL